MMKNVLDILGRSNALFEKDIENWSIPISEAVESSTFLVLGGAGSIGQAVTKEIFKRGPRKLHVVDLSENNLAELVRDIRSGFGYIDGDFKTFAIDIGSEEYDAFIQRDGAYDYVLNLSALKHVRSEEDPFTLMRMINVNILNVDKSINQAISKGSKKYFCVSTDKAANPANMMGASKRIMEMFLMRGSSEMPLSTARFANVAFSDGSLLHSFNQRILKRQPIVAPNDIKRYFLTPQESGELCLLSCLLGENRDVFFPKLEKGLGLTTFSEIAERYLKEIGYEPFLCNTEDEARILVKTLPDRGEWPLLITASDTTGEKHFEEFFTETEVLDMDRFDGLGIIKNELLYDEKKLSGFEAKMAEMRTTMLWDKDEIVKIFTEMIPTFSHLETGKYLDSKM